MPLGRHPHLQVHIKHAATCPLSPARPMTLQGLGDIVSISVLPSFILYRDGQEVHRLEGAPQRRPARALAQAISTHLLSSGKQ